MKHLLSLLVVLAVLACASHAAIHTRVANHIEPLGNNRYSFCLQSIGVPSGSTFTAVFYFSFAHPDGSDVEHDPTFVLGFPNTEAQLIRAVAQGNAIVVHQGDSTFFHWDAEAYRTTAFTTGVVISELQLTGVTLVVEAPEIVMLPEADRFSCDGPVLFVDEIDSAADNNDNNHADDDNNNNNNVVIELPNEGVEGEVWISYHEESDESIIVMPLYIIAVAIVTFMSVACVIRICLARRLANRAKQPVPEDEEMMVPHEIEPTPAPFPMHAQPIMTASGVQYVMVPHEFVQQPQQPQQPQMLVYPGHFVAMPQQ